VTDACFGGKFTIRFHNPGGNASKKTQVRFILRNNYLHDIQRSFGIQQYSRLEYKTVGGIHTHSFSINDWQEEIERTPAFMKGKEYKHD